MENEKVCNIWKGGSTWFLDINVKMLATSQRSEGMSSLIYLFRDWKVLIILYK